MNNNFKEIFVKTLISFSFFIVFYIVYYIINYSTSTDDKQYSEEYKKNYNVYSIPIPDEMFFANEDVPIKQFDVRESFDRELHVNGYWQSQTLSFFKKANRFFPIIEPILKKNGIPDDFKYIAVIESGLSNVVSPAGARGIWQFMPTTAKEYGLEVSDEVDERYHLEKATHAACKYFKDAYKIFNNWTLVAASYNIGMSSLSKQVNKQKVDSYYDLQLNEETSRYIYRILAVKLIMSNPENYGFRFRKKDLYSPIPSTTITVDSAITDLTTFAIENKINYKILKILNPWLRQSSLQNKEKKKYEIKILKEGFREFHFSDSEYNEILEPEKEILINPDTTSNQKILD